jgi:hypothetical protein
LNDDYDALLAKLQTEPNTVKRVASAAGAMPADSNAVYPAARAQQLEAARMALAQISKKADAALVLPRWITRCSRTPRRITLFAAGAALVLISFVWFGPARKDFLDTNLGVD